MLRLLGVLLAEEQHFLILFVEHLLQEAKLACMKDDSSLHLAVDQVKLRQRVVSSLFERHALAAFGCKTGKDILGSQERLIILCGSNHAQSGSSLVLEANGKSFTEPICPSKPMSSD